MGQVLLRHLTDEADTARLRLADVAGHSSGMFPSTKVLRGAARQICAETHVDR
jgi:hypothetical protein